MNSNTRHHVHALVDQLPPVQLAAIEGLLRSMLDAVDDDRLTEEDRAAIRAGLASLDENGGIPMEAVLADFGLTTADFEKMATEPENVG